MSDLGDYFEDTPHAPNDPEVQKAYQSFTEQIVAQAKEILNSGIDVEPFTGKGEPYANSAAMVEDLVKNNHLYFLKSSGGFGGAPAGGEVLSLNNLMLKPSGIRLHGYDLDVNEVTRFVHDFFGHSAEGNQFGPRGEFNAFLKHSQFFTPEAQKALIAELLMQAGWFFGGRHIRRPDGSIPKVGESDYISPANRPFIEPKNLLPSDELANRVLEEVHQVTASTQEAKGQFQPEGDAPEFKLRKPAAGGAFSKAWILPDGSPVQLGGKWHHEFLSENPDVMERFGVESPDPADRRDNFIADSDSRTEALKRGFARLNYARNGGQLTVEARAADWPKLRPAIQQFVETNLDRIDNLRVELFNDDVSAVADSESVKFHTMNSDTERLSSIPFMESAPAGGVAGGQVTGISQARARQFQPRTQEELQAEHQRLSDFRMNYEYGTKEYKKAKSDLKKIETQMAELRQADLTPEGS